MNTAAPRARGTRTLLNAAHSAVVAHGGGSGERSRGARANERAETEQGEGRKGEEGGKGFVMG